jgi:cytochrome bd-type quinol oxidase subunit 2
MTITLPFHSSFLHVVVVKECVEGMRGALGCTGGLGLVGRSQKTAEANLTSINLTKLLIPRDLTKKATVVGHLVTLLANWYCNLTQPSTQQKSTNQSSLTCCTCLATRVSGVVAMVRVEASIHTVQYKNMKAPNLCSAFLFLKKLLFWTSLLNLACRPLPYYYSPHLGHLQELIECISHSSPSNK